MPLGTRRYFIGGSDPRITLGDDKTILMRLWREKHPEAEPDNLPRKPAENLSRRWYEDITGGMPIGTYFVTAFYATAVILVGYAPWNSLLILGLLLSSDEVFRYWISSRWGSSS